ncbi:MAG: tetratricopeptide repeat protein [Deltaproteobacteria bacterium]|nr:tetratricopeptide repeat protein [Deltaproteobacteria bacterium]
MQPKVFISHASADDGFVADLRQELERCGIPVWVDSRELSGGNKLTPKIEQAIEAARQVLVVLSPQTVNSPWVRREVQKALEVEKRGSNDGYRVIPLLLPGLTVNALGNWFDEEPVAVPIHLTPGGLSVALPAILAALGERLPTDLQPLQTAPSKPLEELLLKLSDPAITTVDGKRRVTATATLVYEPAHPTAPTVESQRFHLTAPLGPIETEDLRWYLESYYQWPTGVFQQRAQRIERQLPEWGQQLFRAAVGTTTGHAALTAWQQAATGAERRFSVQVDSDLPVGTSDDAQKAAREAASALLRLPWELLHDGGGYLFQGKNAVRVRRRLPNRQPREAVATALPIRILLVSPRPEDARASYIDHRVSALALVDAVEQLGDLVTLTVLTPPTLPALEAALQAAADTGKPFHVVHFDGHGIYDREHGLGGLCFEDPNEHDKLQQRASALVYADKLAEAIRDHRIPLAFLEACQSAQAENDPTASVAARLLEVGVTSVVAMSHSVLVETARRFVAAFYQALADGARVGQAMLAGQRALYGDSARGQIMGAGELRLQDWFVPVLYQEEHDPQLFTARLPEAAQHTQADGRQRSFGSLPPSPPHKFHGRSRALLALERLLHAHPYAVVSGSGGNGKTALVVELARWLVRSRRYQRAAFVSLETYTDARSVLDSLGRQLLPEGANYSVAQYRDLKAALQPVQRALRDQPTLLVLDNLESVLPDASGKLPEGVAPIAELLQLCTALRDAHPTTRLLFTSREALPAPFNQPRQCLPLSTLDQKDAIELVSQVLAQAGLSPHPSDPGQTPQEIIDLVEAVNCHPRALVLLAPEVSRRGVRATTNDLQQLMAKLDQQHPGERENSLYASVELSLRRLPPALRQQAQALAVFHGGAHVVVLAQVLEVEVDSARTLASALIAVGLAEAQGYGHLHLDPALPSYLLSQLDAAEAERLRTRWAEGMRQLTAYLYGQLSKNITIASQLTQRELPNLLALLTWLQAHASAEEVANVAGQVEELLSDLDRPQALAQAVKVREQAAQALADWGHARFEAEKYRVERLLDSGDLRAAHRAAQDLLQRSRDAGAGAHPGAEYDLATAHFLFGRVLKRSGAAAEALVSLAEAQRQFQALGDAGDSGAAGMASASITEQGDCLRDLGRLEEAAGAYNEAITRDEKRDAKRDVAVGKGQLGTVRLRQRRYTEALKSHTEARELFEHLSEPGMVAVAWHQIGMVHLEQQQFDVAERAYREALVINVRQHNRAGEAGSLGELGNLYDDMKRWEEAVAFYRQAADIHVSLQDLSNEGGARNNLANTLIKLQRYDHARIELQRAIECQQPFGHAATPWNAWDILFDLEVAVGNTQAATAARHQAIDAYLAYRRDGGEPQSTGGQLCEMVTAAIQHGEKAKAEQELAKYDGVDVPASAKLLLTKLHAILNGDRNPALADDLALHYADAAEVRLVLERVGRQATG